MSYKIRIPSTNPDTIGRFAVTPGTPDAIITFPNESGEVATTSDIPVVTTPPSTIYQYDAEFDTYAPSSGNPLQVPFSVVTGLSPNYLYRYTFTSELYAGANNYNFGFRIATSTGAQIGLGENSVLFTEAQGGFTTWGGTNTAPYYFWPVWAPDLCTDTWSQVDSSRPGIRGYVSISKLFTTGTTTDSRSISMYFSSNSDNILYGGAVTVEPIKSLI